LRRKNRKVVGGKRNKTTMRAEQVPVGCSSVAPTKWNSGAEVKKKSKTHQYRGSCRMRTNIWINSLWFGGRFFCMIFPSVLNFYIINQSCHSLHYLNHLVVSCFKKLESHWIKRCLNAFALPNQKTLQQRSLG